MSSILPEMMDLALFEQKPGLVLAATLPEERDRAQEIQKPSLSQLFPAQCEVKMLPWGELYLDAMRDYIITTRPKRLLLWPPFTNPRKLSSELRDRFGRLGVQEIALQIATEKATAGTEVGVILPQYSLVGYGLSQFRVNLREQTALRLVLSHPSFWDAIGWSASLVHMSMLVLTIGVETDGVLRFFKCPSLSDIEEQDIVADFKRLLRQGGGTTEFGYVLRDPPPLDAPLSYDLHHPDLAERRDEMVHFGELRRLDKLVDIHRGLMPDSKEDLPRGSSTRGVPFIEPRDIRLDGTLVPQDTRYRIEVPPKDRLESGDICLRGIVTHSERMAVVEVTEDMLPLAAASGVLILRPKPRMTDEDRELLLAYLRSKRALELLRVQIVGPQIPVTVLRTLPVPVPDEALSLAINGLNKADLQFSRWQAELADERDSLFDLFDTFPSPAEARDYLLKIGRVARQRVRAATRVTSLPYRIQTQYPHPIAYRWRVTQMNEPSLESYVQALECAEASLCYLAAVAIVVSHNVEGGRIGYLEEMKDRISAGGPGTNMGDWIAILREVRDSRRFRRIPEFVPFAEVLRFLEQENVDRAVQHLKDRRDDQSHGRGPKGTAVETALKAVVAQLEILLRAIDFTADYPLRYIERTRYDSLERVTHYAYRDLMGDHPLALLEETCSPSREIEVDSLYLVDRNENLHLLRPFLTRHHCQVCERPAVFHLDEYEKDGDVCVLKSLEQGHTIKDGTMAGVFRRSNLLIQ